ncbi:hypothetical protein HDIA_2282 [Hartmannibacter diazotrophicus]|uniref:Uncharacterized protein n=1 Tax=Hartmannibacter diazotrophicus TaxID=1482074 RepID=A0A2C9D6E8_9HYPH|nr:hypothetical protein [Hartmannibacter diazotrophicus]SON55823.1 hypothetical protein HDIA_2282 [Hartmannibacter diazotrophicus]
MADMQPPRADLRDAIQRQAGDLQTLFGTTSDGALALALTVARMARAMSGGSTIAEMKAAAAAADAVLGPLLDAVDAGTVVTTYSAKGSTEADVFAEVGERSTAVAAVFADAET